MKRLRYYAILLSVLSILASCASSGAKKDDDMVRIPKGWFKMGLDYTEFNEGPEHEVYVDTFQLDKYEISAADFARFLDEKGNPDDRYYSFDKFSTVIELPDSVENGKIKYTALRGFENYPANNVSWYGAEAYCRWKGKRLPTEAEWEKAARGDDGRVYPWGNSLPDRQKARYDQKWDDKGFAVMVAVSSLKDGASPYGVVNMAGNVWEWVNDWYRENYTNACSPSIQDNLDMSAGISGTGKEKDKAADTADSDNEEDLSVPRKNPHGPSLGYFKVLRGGSWYDSYGESVTRSTYRFWLNPEDRYLNTGFRCAK